MGHACGHNLIATASIAAGLATAHILKHHSLPGAVKIFGTPGEEGIGGGKIQLLKAGAYKGVDISLISHPSIINNSPRVRTTAFTRLDVEYFGKAAHAANAPWKGINALDALIIAYNAVSTLRQQTMPSDVIGMNITHGGSKPNEIHDYAAGTCVLRATTLCRLSELRGKISACLRAGGAATGARVQIRVTRGYADHVPSLLLASSYERCWNALPGAPDPLIPGAEKYTHVKASTDQGDVSHAIPSVNASFSIPPGKDGGGPHRPDFEAASGTREAYWRAVRVGKCLAGVAVDFLTKEGMRERVWEEFRIRMGEKA
ncbi:hypothetical protein BDU57DRAFT_516940 [Ampelomyces quisqualis]|uniref:Peptidase M20 dimerisation domain-containing protein n=1 Tax=Ampelomyces quisqualis TaxID=50730 RepID=A0A6A5QRU8_AMPQU|nr:hypothetical protein BDU57DRAFT_516940 [Ampelomyces quisqualis]